MNCQICRTQITSGENFCTRCAEIATYQSQAEVIPSQGGFAGGVAVSNSHQAVAHGFGGVFGLHPGVAFFTIAVNAMIFSGDGLALVLAPATGGLDLPVALSLSVIAGAAVGYVTYLAQKKWYGDDHESAKIKALISGILTAIPTGIPGALFGSAAVLAGLLRGKKH